MSTDKSAKGDSAAFDQPAVPPYKSLRRLKNDSYELLCLSKIAHIGQSAACRISLEIVSRRIAAHGRHFRSCPTTLVATARWRGPGRSSNQPLRSKY